MHVSQTRRRIKDRGALAQPRLPFSSVPQIVAAVSLRCRLLIFELLETRAFRLVAVVLYFLDDADRPPTAARKRAQASLSHIYAFIIRKGDFLAILENISIVLGF